MLAYDQTSIRQAGDAAARAVSQARSQRGASFANTRLRGGARKKPPEYTQAMQKARETAEEEQRLKEVEEQRKKDKARAEEQRKADKARHAEAARRKGLQYMPGLPNSEIHSYNSLKGDYWQGRCEHESNNNDYKQYNKEYISKQPFVEQKCPNDNFHEKKEMYLDMARFLIREYSKENDVL